MPDDTFLDDIPSGEKLMLAQRPDERRRTESHYHNYRGTTTLNRRHTHDYSSRTFTVNMLGRHSHRYNNFTSINFDHRHRMNGWTGPNQGRAEVHTHVLAGDTTFNRGHRHRYSDRTSGPIFERDRRR